MIWIALKMLTGDRTKYFGIIFGVTFATMLMAQQMSIFCGIMMLTTSQIRDVRGVDLWVMDRDVLSIDDFKPMSDTTLDRVKSIPGVQWAVPFYKGVTRLRKTSGLEQAAASVSRPRLMQRIVRVLSGGSGGRTFGAGEPTLLQQIMLLGVENVNLIGAPAPEDMLFGSPEDLRKPHGVLVDKYSCQLLWLEEESELQDVDDYRRLPTSLAGGRI